MNEKISLKRPKLVSVIAFLISTLVVTLSHAKLEGQVAKQSNHRSQKSKFSFKTDFLKTFNSDIDISYFENEEVLLPGIQHVDVIMNGKELGVQKVNFLMVNTAMVPCVPTVNIERINIDRMKLPKYWDKESCINVAKVIPGAKVNYDYDTEKLFIYIPQVYLSHVPEGYIDPGRWDNGINSLSVNYSLSGTNTNYHNTGKSKSNYYGNLYTLLRNGAWRFTTYDSYRGGSQQKQSLDHMQAYAQRSISSLYSELSLGDLNTSGDIFNSTSVRGAMLQTDDRMHPWSTKGFAPIVNGIANSNAVVTIKQNGNVLYEKSVPPGEFSFNDIVALGYGGELEVTITENDGSQRKFYVPYSSVPQLLRKDYLRYSLVVGEVRNYGLTTTPYFLESTLQYGIEDGITLYGGLQTAVEQNYSALNSGIAVNTLLGAFSIDATKSFFNIPEVNNKNHSITSDMLIKLGLSKAITRTDTHFNMASYYLAGENYFNIDDAMNVYERRHHGNNNWLPARYRHRLEVTISQILSPGWGDLSLSTWLEKSNHSNKYLNSRTSYLLGYRNNIESIGFSLNLNRTLINHSDKETTFYLNLSVPFGSTIKSRPKLRTSLSYSSDEKKFRAGLSGSQQGDDYNSWINTWFSQSSKALSNFGINVGHTGTSLQKSIGYSQGMNYYSASASFSGGLLFHEKGLISSSYVNDTMALIEAPGATGARIFSGNRSKINDKGYGLVSYVSPYEENMLTLDLKGAPLGFDTEENSKIVIPTSGAVVKVTFTGNMHKSVIRRLKLTDGRYLPFGSRLFDAADKIVATVGQGGIVIFPLTHDNQPLMVKWKENKSERSCIVHSDVNNDIGSQKVDTILFCNDKEYKDFNA